MKGSTISLIFQIFVTISLFLYLADCSHGNAHGKGKDKDKDKDEDKDKDKDEDKGKAKSKENDKKKKCPANENEPWSYLGTTNGPGSWANNYTDCAGTQQSPIQVDSSNVQVDESLGPLYPYGYDIPTLPTVENTGHTVELRPGDDKCRLIIVNNRIYKFHQLHFHWGSDKRRGAEHVIDKVVYPMEMHLVHRSEQGDTVVVAVFFKLQEEPNEILQGIVDVLTDLLYKGNKTPLHSHLKLIDLLPEYPIYRYNRYEGSLTTPDCREGVTWFLVLYPVPIGTEQIKYFRRLYSTTEAEADKGCKISNNYRKPQPLNDRIVYSPQFSTPSP